MVIQMFNQYLDEFLIVSAAHFLALLSPGPDFVLIVRSSLLFKFRIASGVCLGVSLANAFYIALCLISIQSISKVAGLYDVIKYLGAAYLVFLGFRLLSSKSSGFIIGHGSIISHKSSTFFRELTSGFMASLLNPKISLFYLSLFTLVIDETTPMAIQASYGVWMFFIVLLWDLMLTRFIGSRSIRVFFEHFISRVEKVCGIFLVALGLNLALGH